MHVRTYTTVSHTCNMVLLRCKFTLAHASVKQSTCKIFAINGASARDFQPCRVLPV